MRILLAVEDKAARGRLRDVFRARAIIDVAEDTSLETVDYYLRHASTPYQLLIHDHALPEIARQPALARLALGKSAPHACGIARLRIGEPDTDLLRKAYSAITLPTLSPPGLLTAGRVSINPLSKRCEIDGKPMHFPMMQRRILETLCLYGAEGATNAMIADHLYEADSEVRNIELIVRSFISKTNREIRESTGKDNVIVHDRGTKRYRIVDADPNIKREAPPIIHIGPMTFYPEKAMLTLGENKANLTTKESELLFAISNSRSIITTKAIAQQIGSTVESTGIHLVRVRQKMRDLTGGDQYIVTYRQTGLELSNTPV